MNITEKIDELGILVKEIAQREAAARAIKAELIALGAGTYDGLQFFAEVQHYDRATISPALVRKLSNEEFVASVTEVKAIDAVVVKAFE
jgi:hypothetical protein